eukprot:scaffold20138_cov98-Isochrysis_galbana.AAC.1
MGWPWRGGMRLLTPSALLGRGCGGATRSCVSPADGAVAAGTASGAQMRPIERKSSWWARSPECRASSLSARSTALSEAPCAPAAPRCPGGSAAPALARSRVLMCWSVCSGSSGDSSPVRAMSSRSALSSSPSRLFRPLPTHSACPTLAPPSSPPPAAGKSISRGATE